MLPFDEESVAEQFFKKRPDAQAENLFLTDSGPEFVQSCKVLPEEVKAAQIKQCEIEFMTVIGVNIPQPADKSPWDQAEAQSSHKRLPQERISPPRPRAESLPRREPLPCSKPVCPWASDASTFPELGIDKLSKGEFNARQLSRQSDIKVMGKDSDCCPRPGLHTLTYCRRSNPV